MYATLGPEPSQLVKMINIDAINQNIIASDSFTKSCKKKKRRKRAGKKGKNIYIELYIKKTIFIE